MTYFGVRVGHVGALDILFLRTMRVVWDDLEAQIIVKEGTSNGSKP